MTRAGALRAAGRRLLLAWGVLSLGGLAFGAPLVRGLLPWLEPVCGALLPGFAAALRLAERLPDASIVLTLYALDDIRLGSHVVVAAQERLEASTTLLHNLVPPVLLFSALAALPASSRRERLVLLALGLPAAVMVVALITPFHLAGLVESSFQEAAIALGVPRAPPFALRWMLFLEGGGRWLLPILAALGCAGLARAIRGRA